MFQKGIKLESVPIKNMLMLKDKNGVFYLCSLATAFLNKIHGCGTVIDRKVIKCLAVNTDLFYMGESE